MSAKFYTGKLIADILEKLIILNYKSTPFIPNGRILPLDIKRADIAINTIIDAGANIGQTSNYFKQHFPQATIYSFEPVKATFQQLLINTARSKKINCYNQALGQQIVDQLIYTNNHSGLSTLNGVDNNQFINSELIHINTGANFCMEQGIKDVDLLKIDTEGYELNVLKGFEPLLKNHVKMVYAEVGFDRNDKFKTYVSDVLDYLTPHGFYTSNFYEPARWGKGKLKMGFYNMLLINTNLISD